MTVRAILGTLGLCGVLAAAGCGGDPAPRPPRGSPSAVTTGQAPAESASGGPTAAPATGTLLETSHATLHAPAGWTRPYPLDNPDFKNQADRQGLSSVTLADMGVVGSTADPEVELVRTALRGNGHAAAAAATDTDATLGGELAAHASYDEKLFHTEVYGAFHDRVFVWVSYTFFTRVSQADRRTIVEEGLASFRWK